MPDLHNLHALKTDLQRFARLYLGVHLPSQEERAATRRQENAGSIHLVPRCVLPDGPARDQLIQLAEEGREVYCYQSGPFNGTWCVWLETKRMSLAEYQAELPMTLGAAKEGTR